MQKASREKPLVTIGLLSRNRPIFLREAIAALYRWPGIAFELIVFSSGSNAETRRVECELQRKYCFRLVLSKKNLGFRAIPRLLTLARGAYYVWYEDDFLWVEPNWLKTLVDHMECAPEIGKKEWGILSTTALVDRVTNGAMWPSHFEGSLLYEKDRKSFLCTRTACGAPFMFRTALAKSFPECQRSTLNRARRRSINFLSRYSTSPIPVFGTYDAILNSAFTTRGYPVAHVNIKAYHANGPFYGLVYQKQVTEKQVGSSFLEDAALVMKKAREEGWNFQPEGCEWILDLLRAGRFHEYVDSFLEGFVNYEKNR